MHLLPNLSVVLSLSALLVLGANAQSAEDQLVNHLLVNKISQASRIARPVSDAGDNATVTLGLSLIRIESFAAGQRSAELGVWLNMIWEDPRLTWNPSEFGGLSRLTLNADLLWLPDFRPFSAMGYQPDKETALLAVLYSSGKVIYVLPARVRSECSPSDNDTIACSVAIGSWSTSGMQVDLVVSETASFDLSELVPNPDWEVTSATATRREKIYDCCPETYISIAYELKLKRKEDTVETNSVETQTVETLSVETQTA